MKSISPSEQLRNDIQKLREKQAEDGKALKAEFINTIENLKPVNMIKKSFSEILSSQDIRSNFLKVAVTLVSNYFFKKYSEKNSVKYSLKKILLSLLEPAA